MLRPLSACPRVARFGCWLYCSTTWSTSLVTCETDVVSSDDVVSGSAQPALAPAELWQILSATPPSRLPKGFRAGKQSFFCPISLSLLNDPVRLIESSAIDCFEREQLLRWFEAAGNSWRNGGRILHPLSNEELHSLEFEECATLRAEIAAINAREVVYDRDLKQIKGPDFPLPKITVKKPPPPEQEPIGGAGQHHHHDIHNHEQDHPAVPAVVTGVTDWRGGGLLGLLDIAARRRGGRDHPRHPPLMRGGLNQDPDEPPPDPFFRGLTPEGSRRIFPPPFYIPLPANVDVAGTRTSDNNNMGPRNGWGSTTSARENFSEPESWDEVDRLPLNDDWSSNSINSGRSAAPTFLTAGVLLGAVVLSVVATIVIVMIVSCSNSSCSGAAHDHSDSGSGDHWAFLDHRRETKSKQYGSISGGGNNYRSSWTPNPYFTSATEEDHNWETPEAI